MSTERALELVTLSGVPLRLELQWPFHLSTSGADWYVLHGTAHLMDGSAGLQAHLAVSMSQTMKEALPSIERDWAEPLAVNSIRKTVDLGEIAFLKSGKLQPVHVSSRYYSFITQKIQFVTQPDQAIAEMLEAKVFWFGAQQPNTAVWVADPYDAQYVGAGEEKLLELARALEQQGVLNLEGEYATAAAGMAQRADAIRGRKERGVAAGAAATKITV